VNQNIGAVPYTRSFFGGGSGAIIVKNVDCTGRERRLTDCRKDLTGYCHHNEIAGVRCKGKIILNYKDHST